MRLTASSTLPAGVQAGFEEVVVESDFEGLEVQVLLMAQVGHGEHADALEVVHVAAGGELPVVGLHGLLREEVVGDVLDVFAVVGRLGPLRVARLDALGAQLRADGQRGDLHAGVVVIELAVNVPALRGVQVADRVAQRRLPGMAQVQRPGGVGRDELHHHVPPVGGLRAERRAGSQHFLDDLLLGLGLQLDVEEAGAGDIDRLHPLAKRLRLEQAGAQPFGDLARVHPQRLGQLHRGRAREIPMGRDLGRLERRLVARAG
jgi:hypothetical protein